MNSQRFFFITTYDNISGAVCASILNMHEAIECQISCTDPFLVEKPKPYRQTLDNFIIKNSKSEKSVVGNAQLFSAYELQNKILLERTVHPIRKVHLVMPPKLRIKLLIKSWLDLYGTPEKTLNIIKYKLKEAYKYKNNLYSLYNFDYFYKHILTTVIDKKINLLAPQDELFLIALAKVIAYDSADFPVPGKSFDFEKLLYEHNLIKDFLQYLSNNTLIIDEAYLSLTRLKIDKYAEEITTYQFYFADWQEKLLEYYLQLRLQTIYYPHIDQPLASFYKETLQDTAQQTTVNYSKLISIQLNSNRPAQLCAYFDNIEETADHPYDIEVLVNIDDDNEVMKETIIRETAKRKFTINYITTPKPKSFCDLWQPINKLLKITDPNAYFLLNISDEMLFATPGWDSILKKYVGFFPDHIFRLRASRNKFRNYFDRWECSFAQDAIPITTKKWVDIGGNWNPCFGPDSFQQLVAFYLAQEGKFSSNNFLRELPIIDIKFHGDVPSLGMDPKKMWKHTKDHVNAMLICQSYPMQLEARRRAMLLKAHIIASDKQLRNYDVIDIKSKKKIDLINKDTNELVYQLNYSISWLITSFTNQIRKLRFNYYFGAGKENKKNIIFGFAGYLKAKYFAFHLFYIFIRKIFTIIKKMLNNSPVWTLKKMSEKLRDSTRTEEV